MKPEWLENFELDNEAGPAAPLGSMETQALARRAVDQALAPVAAATQLQRSWWHYAGFGAGGALTMVSIFFVVHTRDARCADGSCVDRPAVVAAPSGLTVAPAHTPAPEHATIEAQPIESVSVTALPNAPSAPVTSTRAVAAAVAERIEPPLATASDLLAEANRARRESQWERAASLYERVMRSQADESYAATVALASLRLEHFGDPKGALALYERALADRPGGSLSSRAEAGAARCRRALGLDAPAAP